MANEPQEKPKVTSVVRYVHPHSFSSREIDEKSWEAVGAKGQKKTVWNQENNWAVHVEDLSAAALAYVKTDAGFIVTEA